VGDGIVMDPLGGAKAALSASGTLVYRSGKSDAQPVLVSGTRATATALVSEARDYSAPRFSPDGGRVAMTVSSSQSVDVWVFDRRLGTLTRLTAEGSNQRPEWTADGKRILFISDRGGQPAFWWQPADGSGPAELLYKPEQADPFEGQLSPDGKWLIYRTGPGGKPPRSVFAVRLDGKSSPVPLVTGASYIQMPRLSPDGHWLAYQSNETGVFEVYVRPFPGAGGRVQVSTGGGSEPLWARSGRALYYRSGPDVVEVSVTTGTTFGVGQRRVAITGDYRINPSHQNYDVMPDGSGFLMIRRAGEEAQTILVHNWVRELIAKTAGQNR
jgi:serine/threonine-protein kinase